MHPLKFMPNNQGAHPYEPNSREKKKTQREPQWSWIFIVEPWISALPPFLGSCASNLLSSSVKVSLFPGNNQPGVWKELGIWELGWMLFDKKTLKKKRCMKIWGKKEKPHHVCVMYLYMNMIRCTRMFHSIHRSIHYVNTTKKIKKTTLDSAVYTEKLSLDENTYHHLPTLRGQKKFSPISRDSDRGLSLLIFPHRKNVHIFTHPGFSCRLAGITSGWAYLLQDVGLSESWGGLRTWDSNSPNGMSSWWWGCWVRGYPLVN